MARLSPMRRWLILALVLTASAAAAQPARDDLARTEGEKRLREQQRAAAAKDLAAAQGEIEGLTVELNELNAAQAKGQTRVGTGRARLAALNAREAELAARMGANQAELSRLLGALQMFSKSPPPALFVHPRDAKAAVRAAILIRAVTPQLQKRADGFAAQAAEARRVRRLAAAAAGDLFTTESSIADRASRIEALIAERKALQARLSGEMIVADRDIAALGARADALKQVVARLPAAAPPVAAAQFTRLSPPVSGAPVRRFGQADGHGGRSEGWSWRPPEGARVLAPAAGVVEFAGPVDGWNGVLILRLSDDYHLVLAGLDLVVATPGQTVAAGQPVAGMARRGNMSIGSDAAELHLELRKAGRPVDPARFFAAMSR